MLSLAFLACAATAQVAPRADPAATEFRLVHSFAFGDDFHTGGARPRPPMQASDGRLYGVSYAGGARSLGTVYRVRPGGSVVTVHSFQGSDGNGPEGTLIQASDGNLYGVTSSGGTGGSHPEGTVFRLDSSGVLTTLHTFFGADGARPGAGLVEASDGYLYGTASDGGQYGRGTVFRIGLDGGFQVMHHFGANADDGQRPLAALIQTRDGRLCGTNYTGGTEGGGTLYCMTLDGQMSVLHAFGNGGSTSPLVEDIDGSLYGTANFGGPQGQGSIFRLKPDGSITETGLWARPSGGLLKASDGNFYGTAFWGGQSDKGWVYQLTPAGKVTDVHSFSEADGANPDGELIEVNRRLFGVTESGGATDSGVLFGIAQKRAPRAAP